MLVARSYDLEMWKGRRPLRSDTAQMRETLYEVSATGSHL